MILTITMNPAIDCRYSVKHFDRDTVNRCQDYGKTAGGKGINVARVLKHAGEEALATGFIGGPNGHYFKELLGQDQVEGDFVSIQGNTRLCLAILDEAGGQTELLESGPEIQAQEIADFDKKYDDYLEHVGLVCISGSLASGLPVDYYQSLCQRAKAKGIPLILDTSGEALKEGLKGSPYMIKPNKDELAMFFGKRFETSQEMIIACQQLIADYDIQLVGLSLGAEGALIISKDRVYKGLAPCVEVVNPVGSGDSMVAGFARGLVHGDQIEDILRWGIAFGTANAMEVETGRIDWNRAKMLFEGIGVEVQAL